MQKLRSLHLYLGCLFAPLLLFFAVSGIGRTFGVQTQFLRKLSTIHTGARWKDGSDLSSLPLKAFVLVMALSFILTTVPGVVMALKFGRSRRATTRCMAAGVILPALLIVLRLLQC